MFQQTLLQGRRGSSGGGGSLQRYFLFVFSMTVSLAPFMAFSSSSLASMPYTFNQWHSQGVLWSLARIQSATKVAILS